MRMKNMGKPLGPVATKKSASMPTAKKATPTNNPNARTNAMKRMSTLGSLKR